MDEPSRPTQPPSQEKPPRMIAIDEARLQIEAGEVKLPEGLEGVMTELTLIAGYGPLHDHPVVDKVTEDIPGSARSIGISDAKWGACIQSGGTGWIDALCLRVVTPPHKDLLIIPFSTNLSTKRVELRANSKTESVSATVEMGPHGLSGSVDEEDLVHADTYEVRVRGSIDEAPEEVLVYKNVGSKEFSLGTVPSSPLFLVIRKENTNLSTVGQFVQAAQTGSKWLVAEHGYGLFSASIEVQLPRWRQLVSTEYFNPELLEEPK